MASTPDTQYEKVAPINEVRAQTPYTVTVNDVTIAVFHHDGEFYATNPRCPHMGFPLSDGTIDDGILTCPWHHARFELSCGDTFDPFADDVQTYPVEIHDNTLYVATNPPREQSPQAHWEDRLEHGLQENIRLVIAKAVLGLAAESVPYTVPVRIGVDFGTHYQADGWGSGLTTLSVMTNLHDELTPKDRQRALYTGLTDVASDCSGEPPFFVQEPLATTTITAARCKAWFRENIDVRDADGAERVIRTAIQAGFDDATIAGMFVAAATDHLYLDSGHRLDFINKAFELLDHLGWTYADTVLPSLVPRLADANRAEEDSSWRQPIDLAALCKDAAADLPGLLDTTGDTDWVEPDSFVDTLLGDDPQSIMTAITDAIAAGATATELAEATAAAAARRIVQFGTSNEFRDWNTVHHTYTYANAVHSLCQRTTTPEVYRGVFTAAMSVYRDRFLNTPPAPIPDPDGTHEPESALDSLMETFEVESTDEIGRAGRLTAEYLAAGGDSDRLKQQLGTALLREDVGFHSRQNLEAAFSQYDAAATEDRRRLHLIGTARYLAAHTPTRRAGEQTFRIADRLNRGERIHEQ